MTTQSPVLREFTDAARRHFSFLISDFGFSEAALPNDKDINEFQVRYLSARVLVTRHKLGLRGPGSSFGV